MPSELSSSDDILENRIRTEEELHLHTVHFLRLCRSEGNDVTLARRTLRRSPWPVRLTAEGDATRHHASRVVAEFGGEHDSSCLLRLCIFPRARRQHEWVELTYVAFGSPRTFLCSSESFSSSRFTSG